jgi:hypothetical protein
MELFTSYCTLADTMLSWGLEPRYSTLINMTIAQHNSHHWIHMLLTLTAPPPPPPGRTREIIINCSAGLLGNRVSFFVSIRLCGTKAFKRTVISCLLYQQPNVVFHYCIQFLIFIGPSCSATLHIPNTLNAKLY